MPLSDALVAEFTHESAVTRKLLERLPEDKLSWKPHPRSMSLGGLSTHIANIPDWIRTLVNDAELDMGSVGKRTELGSRQEILADFDEKVKVMKETLSGKPDDHLFQSWTLKKDGAVVLTLPRAACIRSFILSHVIHHRGQLSVYLRENDVPLPSIYGPSADEGF